jgi:hypothetical protein
VGAEVIEEVWKERLAKRAATKQVSTDGNGATHPAGHAQRTTA